MFLIVAAHYLLFPLDTNNLQKTHDSGMDEVAELTGYLKWRKMIVEIRK